MKHFLTFFILGSILLSPFQTFSKNNKAEHYISQLSQFANDPDSLRYYGQLLLQYELKDAQFEGYYSIAYSYYKQMHFDSALYFFNRAKSVLSDQDEVQLARVLRMEMISLSRAGQLDQALDISNNLIALSIQSNDSNSLAAGLNSKGLLYRNKGEYNKAIEHFTQVAEIEKLRQSPHIINSYTNIGVSFSNMKQHQQALNWFRKAYFQSIESEVPPLKTRATINLGNHFRVLNQLDSAKFYLLKILDEGMQVDNHQKAVLYQDLAAIAIEEKKYSTAVNYLTQLQEMIMHSENQSLRIEFFNVKTKLFKSLTNYDSALIYTDSSISLARSNKYFNRLSSLYFTKAEIFEEMGNAKAALDALLDYTFLKDSLNKLKDMKAIQSVISEFEFKEKQKELEAVVLASSNFNKRFYILALITTLVLILIALFYRSKQKTKRQKLALETNKESLKSSIDNVVAENKEEKLNEVGLPNDNVQQSMNGEEEDFIILKSKQVIRKSDILFIKTHGHYLDYFLEGKDKPVIERNSLSELSKELIKAGFFRSHRSYLVNSRKVKAIQSKNILLTNDMEVPLSRDARQKLQKEGHFLFS